MLSKRNLLTFCRRLYSSAPSTLAQKRHKASIVDGKLIASKIINDAKVRDDIVALSNVDVTPKVVAIVVGDVAESKIYVERKKSAAADIGVDCHVKNVSADTSQDKLVSSIMNKL
jgi:methylenetetrahydrofolate dehydrogenase (NADP+) / methenyltetrahydrofolate cyclohydrolase